ncbi:MAG TPA: DUF3052 domain-containing protein [Candidatus Kapabacteria bacterium]|jgi:hypothetical protein
MASKNAKARKQRTKTMETGPVSPAGYSTRPLAGKLGIKAHSTMAVLDAPEAFPQMTGIGNYDTALDLDSYDYLHFFTMSKVALETIFPILAKRLNRGGTLWISWPKKASGKQTDLGENAVRELGLCTGLVDVKVCALDETWSGLKFMHRREKSK